MKAQNKTSTLNEKHQAVNVKNGDIMAVANDRPVIIPPTTTIIDSIKTMAGNSSRRLIVADAGTKRLEAILTSTDIMSFLGGENSQLVEKHFKGNFLAAANAEVRNIMHENVTYLDRHASIEDAIKIMIKQNIGGVPIVDEKKCVCGICTEKDFLRVVAEVPANKSVDQYMSKRVKKAPSDTTIENAAKMMIENRIRRLPVIKDNILLGLVTASDMVEYLAEGHAFENIVTGNFHEAFNVPVSSLIKKDLVWASSDTDLGEAAKIMRNNDVSSLPVIDDGVLCGIITERDILRAISE
ncbi:CBS domain-containing protein [Methanolobus sp. ZRKC3]